MTDSRDRLLGVLSRPDAILLDMDGVIADVSRSYRAAILETVRRFGAAIEAEEIAAAKRRGQANNDWELSCQLLKDHGVQVDLAEVTACFEALYQGGDDRSGLYMKETLIPSVADLRRLASQCSLAIVTGRPRADANQFIRRFELGGFFSSCVCLEDAPQKPDPAPARLAMSQLGLGASSKVWMVGDTPDDMACATRAGIVALGLLAPGDAVEPTEFALRQAGAQRILKCFEQLVEMMQ